MPRLVRSATFLAFCLHGVSILTARYRLSYDAYNHMFFADHYRLAWWALWEPRWYTGFEVVSYPPLVHQLNALVGHVIGVDAAFGLILWIVLTAYPLAVYLFCRIFAGPAVSGYAALGAAVLPSLYLTAQVFGQLPTLAATLLALFGAAALADYLRNGTALKGALAVSLFATAMAAHHATLLFLVALVGMIALNILPEAGGRRRLLYIRLAIFSVLASVACWLVVFPFWQWGAQQTLQTPIDHASRHSFFTDPSASVLFFFPMYGLLIPLIPFALWQGTRKPFLGPGLAFFLLFLLGLGGTTPLPRLLFRQSWVWLTYDRFALWASLVLLPFLGVAFVVLRRKLPDWPKHRSGSYLARRQAEPVFVILMALAAMIIAFIPTWLPTQPAQLDMQPIVDFLAQDDRARWRYVTFGFGDQFAYLSRLTGATTIDGSYHTARTLPELRESGIGQIDSAYWIHGGMAALGPILQKSGEHGVRWAFVDLRAYDALLRRYGWRMLVTLANGVEVWENPSATPPPLVTPPRETPVTVLAWGTLPLLALLVSGALALRRFRPTLGCRVRACLRSLTR